MKTKTLKRQNQLFNERLKHRQILLVKSLSLLSLCCIFMTTQIRQQIGGSTVKGG